jgi:hypothetical protein
VAHLLLLLFSDLLGGENLLERLVITCQQTLYHAIDLLCFPGDDAASVITAGAVDVLAAGMSVATENFSPEGGKNPFKDPCGVDNTMWPETGNLLFPWRAKLTGPDASICTHDPTGPMVLIDHVSITWMNAVGGGHPDVLTDAHFDSLKGKFDQALLFMEQQSPKRPAAWGFVTHINEYAALNAAENPPEQSALDALEKFLAYVALKEKEGRVTYATASEIAQAVDNR